MSASRILIVEDEGLLAWDMADLLSCAGHEVAVASSGEEAVWKAQEICPDLVIADVALQAEMDGIEAAMAIRSQRDAAIIYLTAHSDQHLLERAKITEPFGFLVKPVLPQELYGTVEMALYKHEMERRLRASEHRFRNMFEHHGAVMFVVDPETLTIIDANKAAEEFYGHDRDAFLEKRFPDLSTLPEEEIRRELQEALQTGRHHHVCTHKLAGGDVRDVEVYAHPITLMDREVHFSIVHDISDRKRAEEALQAERAKFRTLVDSAPFGLAVIDRTGTFQYLNPKFSEMFGYDLEDMPNGKVWLSEADPEPEYTRDAISAWISNLGRSELDEQLPPRVFEVRCKDGTIKAVDFRPVQLPSGEQLLTCEDVTERKRAEQALKESEEKYRRLVDLAPDGIHVNVGGCFAFANAAMARLLGIERPEELLGKEVCNFVHPDYQRSARERVNVTLHKNASVPLAEERFIRVDGTDIDVEVAAAGITFQGQKGAQVVVRDITERKRAEAALRESEEKYRLVVENAYESIMVIQDGMLKFVNPRVGETLGLSDEELQGAPYLDFIHPDDRDTVLQRLEKRIRGEPIPPYRPFRLVKKDGSIRWVETSAVLITWEGRPALLGFVTDVTNRRKMEEELLKAEKLKSVGILAGGIAHDFNNILAAILGNISLAKVYASPADRIHRRLAQAERACLRAQGLAQQLLTFATGGTPVKEATDICRLVEECCLFAVQGSNVKCEFAFSPHVWPVDADAGQMSQVFHNLIINAVHAMPQGGTIHVKADNVTVTGNDRSSLEPGPYVSISVEDQGVGIDEQNLTKIFDPYFSTKSEGIGLGLATSYAVVNRHGGTIAVASNVGAGTTFHVYLPATHRDIQPQENFEEKPAFGKGRILLMDDEEMLRELGKELLSALGYEVTVAEHGGEAIELYTKAKSASRPFDAIIVDLTVPGGLGGQDVVRVLRETDPNLKAIVSSGYSSDPVMADYRRHGFSGVVAKPYTIQEVSEILKEVLES